MESKKQREEEKGRGGETGVGGEIRLQSLPCIDSSQGRSIYSIKTNRESPDALKKDCYQI